MPNSETYLRAILGILARQSFSNTQLMQLVGKGKQLEAYNLCDGTKTQGEVAKALSLDSGNFSKTVARWAELGIIVKVAEGKEVKLLHLYPLTLGKKEAS